MVRFWASCTVPVALFTTTVVKPLLSWLSVVALPTNYAGAEGRVAAVSQAAVYRRSAAIGGGCRQC
jgi:hypothetical protein